MTPSIYSIVLGLFWSKRSDHKSVQGRESQTPMIQETPSGVLVELHISQISLSKSVPTIDFHRIQLLPNCLEYTHSHRQLQQFKAFAFLYHL